MKRALGHKSFEQTANQIARRYGHAKATKVILGYQSRILESVILGIEKLLQVNICLTNILGTLVGKILIINMQFVLLKLM